MDFQEYLDKPNYLHSTDLKLIMQSINSWLAKTAFEQTRALKLGQLGHTMILEIDKLTERYLVMPKVDGRTTKGQEQKLLAESQAREMAVDHPPWGEPTKPTSSFTFLSPSSRRWRIFTLAGPPRPWKGLGSEFWDVW